MCNYLRAFILGGLISVLSGCVLNLKPDLVVVRQTELGEDPIAYCKLDNNRLIVTAKNEGRGDAPATVTRVVFTSIPTGNVIRNLNTPALASGTLYAHKPLIFPEGCFQPDCHFDITVDSTSVVDESNEGNNSGKGYCLG